MSHVSDLRLDDLPDVEPYLINKLKRAGIQSVLDLAISIPHELAEGGGGNYIDDDDNTAITSDIETISQLVSKAKKALIDSGALSKEFCTAEEFLERRNSLVRFTTGSMKLDSFLKGGIESQAITEIAGEFGSGKSQLCHTLCVTAVANNTIKEKNRIRGDCGRNNNNNSIIFIDTENTFRPERIHQIAEGRGLEPEEIMKKVFVCKIYNSAHLEAIIKNLGKSIEHYKAKLVIIDSIISLHRAEFPGRETLAERQQRLNVMLHKLIRLAEVYNVAVVLTNQVQSQPDDFFGGGDPTTRAAGGNIMGHASTYRIFLGKAGRDRIAIMVDSPHHAYGQTRFTISEKGIQDTEQEDKESTGNSDSNKYSESGW
jgi:DNA repair protein RadA